MTLPSNPRCMVIGDINVDVIMHCQTYPSQGDDILVENLRYRLGGSGCNTAAVMAKLGVSTEFVGHVGADPFGHVAMQKVADSGISIDMIEQRATYSTGLMMILISPGGQRTIFGCRGSNVTPFPVKRVCQRLNEVDTLHISGYTLLEENQWLTMLEILQEAKLKNIRISLDPGLDAARKVQERFLKILPLVDDLLISKDELAFFFPRKPCLEASEEMLKLGVGAVSLKMGARGSLYRSRDAGYHQAAIEIKGREVVDTTGAGDCFNAGYLFGGLNGLHPANCLLLGNVIAHLAITSHKGIEEILEDQDLKKTVKRILSIINKEKYADELINLL